MMEHHLVGRSNGGYMTMEMLLHYPHYFAAAFPICEAYHDEYITDDQIDMIKHIPMWFTYAKTDRVIDHTICTIPTIKRLVNAGVSNVHVSVFDDVYNTTGLYKNEDGPPYTYNGHCFWSYWDDNECNDGDLNAWEWLGQQGN